MPVKEEEEEGTGSKTAYGVSEWIIEVRKWEEGFMQECSLVSPRMDLRKGSKYDGMMVWTRFLKLEQLNINTTWKLGKVYIYNLRITFFFIISQNNLMFS